MAKVRRKKPLRKTASDLASVSARKKKRRRRHRIVRDTRDAHEFLPPGLGATLEENVRLAIEHAHAAAVLSEDPAKRAALECVKVAMFAVTGARDSELPPLDCLDELKRIIRGSPPKADDASVTYRTLAELVKRRIGPRRAPREEGAGLRRDILAALGEDWNRITDDACIHFLSRAGTDEHPSKLQRKGNKKIVDGELSVNGIVQELVVAAGVIPGTKGAVDKAELRNDIRRAVHGRKR